MPEGMDLMLYGDRMGPVAVVVTTVHIAKQEEAKRRIQDAGDDTCIC